MKEIILDDADLIYIKHGKIVQKDGVRIEYGAGHEEDWTHVFPIGDTYPHNTEDLTCSCSPKYDLKDLIVIHNAWDMREADEITKEL